MQKESEETGHKLPFIRINELGVKFELNKSFRLKDFLLRRTKRKTFYALKNFSLEANAGDVIALFGKNGSGKSTLLRTIAGIYSYEEGNIETRGKISLLNINSGFNNDLDGISNIYLAMSLYGMNKRTIDSRIKDIIAFTDIGKFIYEPIRTYSTGMAARLGFAIGINVEADIILIDETLSVGDKEFREKCLRKIEELTNMKNKIIIIASHDEDTVLKYCKKTIRLSE